MKQLNMSMDKLWPVVRRIIDDVYTEGKETNEEANSYGEFVLMKDITGTDKLEYKIYKKDNDDDGGDEEEGEEEEGEQIKS